VRLLLSDATGDAFTGGDPADICKVNGNENTGADVHEIKGQTIDLQLSSEREMVGNDLCLQCLGGVDGIYARGVGHYVATKGIRHLSHDNRQTRQSSSCVPN
jgi:hypothetical protein